MKCYITDQNGYLVETKKEFENKVNTEMKMVSVDPNVTYQEILGMGGAFTEAAAYTYFQMSEEKQKKLLELYFGNEGNKYNFCRTHIQSCDFALGNYAYVEDSQDKDLETFSIERDKKYLMPMMKAALKKNKEIQLLASPWSPPAFMKTNGEMNHGGKLKPEFYQMWADMVARYVTEYEKEGIKISRLTVQNEPNAAQAWDSCLFTGAEERDFVCGYLKQSLENAGHGNVKINIWDHNKERVLERAKESLDTPEAMEKIDGIAFHWYTGDHFETLQEVHRQYPDKELIFTEGCVEYSRFANANQVANAEMYAHDIIGDFNSGMNGYIDWNLILDEKGGPNHVNNFCDAPVMCNIQTDEIDVKLSYYYIGHFSRFISPGAKRILVSRYMDRVEATGFINPDGSRVVIIMNRTDEQQEFVLREKDEVCDFNMEPHSIMTVCW